MLRIGRAVVKRHHRTMGKYSVAFSTIENSEKRVTGTVKSWKGKTGTITMPDGEEFRVFQKNILSKTRPKFRSLFEGTTVEFCVESVSKSDDETERVAVGVSAPGGEPLPRYRHYDANGNLVLRPSWRRLRGRGDVPVKSVATYVGKVVSTKMSKTAVVEVTLGVYEHPKYGKFISKKQSYACHDPHSECRFGDVVEIQSCDPVSKRKVHKVTKIIKKENYIDRNQPKRLVIRDEDLMHHSD